MTGFCLVLSKSKPMNIQLLWTIFKRLMCSISNIELYISTWTYGKHPRHFTDVQRKIWILYLNNKNILNDQNNAVWLHSWWGYSPQEFKPGIILLASFSNTAEQKTFLAHFVALNGIRVILKKNESNQCTIQGVEAKKKESYQMTVEERYTTFRAKIEQINLRVKRDS